MPGRRAQHPSTKLTPRRSVLYWAGGEQGCPARPLVVPGELPTCLPTCRLYRVDAKGGHDEHPPVPIARGFPHCLRR